MKTPTWFLTLFLISSACFGQLTVRNDAYLFVSDTYVYVEDDVNLKETNSTVYLRNDGQLLQGAGTTGNAGSGKLSVYQEGTVHNYAYNFWASPVGNVNIDANGNSAFKSDASILNDVTDLTSSTPAAMIGGYDGTSSPLGIARFWLHGYSPGTLYAEWDYIGDGSDLAPGYGFTMKGTTGSTSQQYDFRGKPNSGTLNTAVLNGNYTLVGNPYPSALDAAAYIHDTNNSSVITGTLFFWEQDMTAMTHYLNQSVGGYAIYTIASDGTMENFVPAVFTTFGPDGYPNSTGSSSMSGKTVKRYLPVGQGFMIEGAADGNAQVKNEHRVYYKESDSNSEFFKTASSTNSEPDGETQSTTSGVVNEFQYDENGLQILPDLPGLKRFRLNVDFNNETTRQLLHNFHPDATDGFDYGLESNNLEPKTRDAYFILGDMPYITQAHSFDINLKIPLVIKLNANMPLRVRLFDVQHFDSQPIYMHDKVTDIYYDLTSLNFEANLETGTYTDRFEITFTNGVTLSTTQFEDSNFTVFQNNTLSQLVIANPESLDIKSVSLVDIAGKQIFKRMDLDTNERHEFSTKNLSEGVYIVTVTLDNNNVLNKKIIVSNK
ncbi:T9SS type A sorting domain-containing protein [Lacinutrix sp. Hel_I_90]|uniref:T9SS type A sorting domain-containing protein n=1 Tax=Lacinutrix sp. Hel_I_90 TaxID=1249999 RepID=UPI0005C890C0|nr:T9SS type A sorting domain-containing protein [Lacinutrix sp. Hel_I_90]